VIITGQVPFVILVPAFAGEAHSRVMESAASRTRVSLALWRAPHPDVSSEANCINVFLMLVTSSFEI
jgi:hypothetical protein